ncbi:hypothetical protein NEUTE1DRAFT_90495 [Neurospora tetrasperma FGSC 2508]|uniref:Protein kinase domain-containing protein n=1 Tax=Neurospora tetrasperma (strain FGSC 2508 / ATCC MYA-4615 / P0657) TaxID=510951 RepID=F8N1J7_NEUT8|nr:uncharacterized protein NEUTE1DRAFT_90495 [Neurospora tetrasperma FGSC 2508]EGO52328.1 hypothetical protein NEUTE1DRAFT_90495 [Neurospora tetrasperma FGSC 2508]
MTPQDDSVNFDIIESHKENIQALPSGRSARKLAELFSPSHGASSSRQALAPQLTPTPNPTEVKSVNDAIRAEYEAELAAFNPEEQDDPLDIYDRYVRWTLDAYPSASATPQSQLHLLLERATRAFVGSAQYRNDARYLKMWLHYIRMFSDSPREAFVFLSRHQIGEQLALYYEEFAAYLEGEGRWAQAEEVYKMGIEKEARPVSRLVRKFGEFEQRRAALPEDAAAQQPALGSLNAGSKGWDSIGSLADRKKENTMEPKPWAGEVLKAGGKKPVQKMQVFRDTTKKTTNPMMMNKQQLSQSHIPIHHSQSQVTVNPVTGKRERVFVDLRVIYPTPDEPGTELSFEEIWAARRGWLDVVWEDESKKRPLDAMLTPKRDENMEDLTLEMASTKIVAYHDVLKLDENGKPIYPEHKAGRSAKKKKVIEVNETQIIKAKLDSPSGPKMKKRGSSSEPTMTLHTKAATDDIYDIFNAPLKPTANPSLSDDENRYDSDDYTCGVDDTSKNLATSEAGDETTVVEAIEETDVADEDDDVKSEWSDFTARKHIPDYQGDGDEDHEMTDVLDEENGQPETSHSQFNHNEVPDENPTQGGRPLTQNPPPAPEEVPPTTRNIFVPVPPADYVPTRRPYRDPVEVANNRLPFMTPITERTEFSSLDVTYHHPNMHHPILTKTPSKAPGLHHDMRDDMSVDGEEEDGQYSENEDEDMLEPESSPLREIPEEDEEEEEQQEKFSPIPVFHSQLGQNQPAARSPLAVKSVTTSPLAHRAVSPLAPRLPGPIIKELQCNPVDELIRKKILANIYPPLTSYEGFHDHRHEKFRKGAEIRKFAQAQSAASKRGRKSTSADKRDSLNEPHPIMLQLPGNPSTKYTIKKELGAGAYAPVYLVENSKPTKTASQTGYGYGQQKNENNNLPAHLIRHPREALKMEQPPTAWEFYMMRLAHTRLLAANTSLHHRALASLSPALELHLYQDEGFLFLPFFQHGTLLDVINLFRSESSGVMDEQLAMFFTVELFRAIEALHSVGIMHGDVKVDNCLLRLPTTTDILPTNQYHADGSGGWAARGLTLIDFGRGIDFRQFREEVQFVADWKPTAQDCAEMREGRPWTWQIDYHGLAGVVHALLFGKYIDTVPCGTFHSRSFGGLGGNDEKRYKITENLKRYWQTDIWGHCFDLLLNPGSYVDEEEGGNMPVLKGLRTVRERMESWLEANCERGVGLRGWMGKVEAWSRGRR